MYFTDVWRFSKKSLELLVTNFNFCRCEPSGFTVVYQTFYNNSSFSTINIPLAKPFPFLYSSLFSKDYRLIELPDVCPDIHPHSFVDIIFFFFWNENLFPSFSFKSNTKLTRHNLRISWTLEKRSWKERLKEEKKLSLHLILGNFQLKIGKEWGLMFIA